eukprot:6793079-Alexandrium_andersonii.AAC.1
MTVFVFLAEAPNTPNPVARVRGGLAERVHPMNVASRLRSGQGDIAQAGAIVVHPCRLQGLTNRGARKCFGPALRPPPMASPWAASSPVLPPSRTFG